MPPLFWFVLGWVGAVVLFVLSWWRFMRPIRDFEDERLERWGQG